MSKEQIVADAKVQLQTQGDQLLIDVMGSVYDKALAEAPPVGVPGPSESDIQARIDAALASKQAEDDQKLSDQKALDDQALADSQSKVDGLLGDLSKAQKDLSDLSAKEVSEKALIDGLQGSIDGLKSVLSQLQAIFPPAPAPVPQPEPAPQPDPQPAPQPEPAPAPVEDPAPVDPQPAPEDQPAQ